MGLERFEAELEEVHVRRAVETEALMIETIGKLKQEGLGWKY